MCQQYENERRAICSMENDAAGLGFKDASLGKEEDSNPYTFRYEREAWEHGWSCYQGRMLPWAIEKILRDEINIETSISAMNEFKESGRLTEDITKVLRRFWAIDFKTFGK